VEILELMPKTQMEPTPLARSRGPAGPHAAVEFLTARGAAHLGRKLHNAITGSREDMSAERVQGVGRHEPNAPAPLARISHQLSTAAADPGMSTALRSVRLLDVLSSTPAEPSVARLVSMPVCTASLRNLVRKAG
jgi:hypothetical protein